MNTPSHAIVNLAMMGKAEKSRYNLPIVLGGILPDVPIFVFYLWVRFIRPMPVDQIWSEGYYQPFWQDLIAAFHSIPLALIGFAIAHKQKWQVLKVVFVSMVLHDLLDLPVHHDDAHRHFFPFSDYRFISPISYYDPNHYGNIVAVIEVVGVLMASLYVDRFIRSGWGRGGLILVNGFYLVGYIVLYLANR